MGGEGMNMHKALLSLVSGLALISSANAADIFRAPDAAGGFKDGFVPVASWTGFYAGLNGGGGWSEFNDQLAFPRARFGGLSPSGGFGGGQLGYNWQGIVHPRLVFGIEADIQGAGIDDRVTLSPTTWSSQLNLFGTVRGRAGYAIDQALVYFTGGFAYGDIINEVSNRGTTLFLKDTTATGFVLGGGLEYKLSRAMSVKVEYQFIDLGKNDPTNAAGQTFTSRGGIVRDDAFHTVRAGINFHLSPAQEPLK
jgi:outer membrane immunogenic protein